ncbi:MAG: TetR/AcrR family transcriptional regulator [Alphaproteobacteria bacterium]|nr:TetR/AcrR family transcriptional regulator [Alphaproteobacteria bacterium]
MGDIKTTDRNPVLAAMELFWAEGAEVASYNDIVSATGLSRKALYQRWPDKDALIYETLQLYYGQLRKYALAPLSRGGYRGLVAFWDTFENAARRPAWRGCYLFRTASGPMRSRQFVGAMLERYADEFYADMAAQIAKGQADGEIAAAINPESAALLAFALAGMISVIGASAGYTDRVAVHFEAARASCGV